MSNTTIENIVFFVFFVFGSIMAICFLGFLFLILSYIFPNIPAYLFLLL